MARFGFFGGTFDPIHTGHLIAAQEAYEQLGLDRLVFVPAGLPPHKTEYGAAEGRDRLEMIRRAILDDPRFAVSAVEIERVGPSYTLETVRILAAELPRGSDLFFILGDDCAANLHRWKGIEELLERVTFVSVPRTGAAPDPAIAAKILKLDFEPVAISASRIRKLIREGHSPRFWTPPSVADYLERQGLYLPEQGAV